MYFYVPERERESESEREREKEKERESEQEKKRKTERENKSVCDYICSLPLWRVHEIKRMNLAPRTHGLFIT